MSMKLCRAFAPATVSNVGPGFDCFGFAVEGLGDVVEARATAAPGVHITAITGDGGALPRDPERNTAGVAAAQVLRLADAAAAGVTLTIAKGMPLTSGLGSSAASAVAAAVAVDGLLGSGLSKKQLLACAVKAEAAGCGAEHGDNVAPSLYGGFVLVRQGGHRVDPLPVPPGLHCALLRPHRSVETGAARALLGDRVPLAAAVRQWGNTAALVAALFRGDFELLASALEDAVAEPLRGPLQAGFAQVQAAARQAGALGCSLSGSGPTIFALTRGASQAQTVVQAMAKAFAEVSELPTDAWTSPVGAAGARILPAAAAPGKSKP
jgi:homoserine kinase